MTLLGLLFTKAAKAAREKAFKAGHLVPISHKGKLYFVKSEKEFIKIIKT